jgi:UDP-N-acetylglucosamine diphosphorylase / glucose-1-phosphate thymidylyltransferase / UDP-N-acetylgalactosamine diphosphorylase / glucosamine-1-phosphate N-acetyltransferase / galactosamine-1-phosphate N-acetyltransferase
MAAGQGTRLRPLTERWPKPVLPIDGRPVIATLLRELAAAGCTRVGVVTGHLAEQVEELVGDGGAFGLDVQTVRQPSVLGSGDAVQRALAAGVELPCLVTAADTVFGTGDVKAFADAFARSGAAGAMSGRREPAAELPHRAAVRIVDGLVVKPIDDDPANPLGSAPLWAIGPELRPFLAALTGPPFELGVAFERAIAAGLPIAGFEIGKTRDLTYPIDLVKENFPYLES